MVSRERRPSRHRAAPHRPAVGVPDEELESYLAAISPAADFARSEAQAESRCEAGPAASGRFGAAAVFQVRLPGPAVERVRQLAEARGVSTTALLVDWVLERLRAEDSGPAARAPITPPAPRREEWSWSLSGRGAGPRTGVHPVGETSPHSARGAGVDPNGPTCSLTPLDPTRSVDPLGAPSAASPHSSGGVARVPVIASDGGPDSTRRPPSRGTTHWSSEGSWYSPASAALSAQVGPLLSAGKPAGRDDAMPLPGGSARSGSPGPLREPDALVAGSDTALTDSPNSFLGSLTTFAQSPLGWPSLGHVEPSPAGTPFPDTHLADEFSQPRSMTPVGDALASMSSAPPVSDEAPATDEENSPPVEDSTATAVPRPTATSEPKSQSKQEGKPEPSGRSEPKLGQVTPIFRAGTELPNPDEHRGPRHRAPEPVTSLLSRRKF